jgi:hypothetical protein
MASKPVTFDELLALRERINRLYLRAFKCRQKNLCGELNDTYSYVTDGLLKKTSKTRWWNPSKNVD